MQVLKDLAGAEDILLDAELPNTVEQSRGGSDYTITKVSAKTIPYTGTFGQPGAVYIKDKLDDIDTILDTIDTSLDLRNSVSRNTIVDLKLENGLVFNTINVLGYYTKGDGGGGTFYWDSTSTETDNGGTIIQATGITTGRWKKAGHAVKTTVNALEFGAKADWNSTIGTDNTSVFTNAINHLGTIGGGTLIIPAGYYKGKLLINRSNIKVIAKGAFIGYMAIETLTITSPTGSSNLASFLGWDDTTGVNGLSNGALTYKVSSAVQGNNYVTLENSTGLNIGDSFVLISGRHEISTVATNHIPLTHQIMTVTSISGNIVYVNDTIDASFTSSSTVPYLVKDNYVKNISIEGGTFTNLNGASYSMSLSLAINLRFKDVNFAPISALGAFATCRNVIFEGVTVYANYSGFSNGRMCDEIYYSNCTVNHIGSSGQYYFMFAEENPKKIYIDDCTGNNCAIAFYGGSGWTKIKINNSNFEVFKTGVSAFRGSTSGGAKIISTNTQYISRGGQSGFPYDENQGYTVTVAYTAFTDYIFDNCSITNLSDSTKEIAASHYSGQPFLLKNTRTSTYPKGVDTDVSVENNIKHKTGLLITTPNINVGYSYLGTKTDPSYSTGIVHAGLYTLLDDANGNRAGLGINGYLATAYSNTIARITTSKTAWAFNLTSKTSAYQNDSTAALLYMDASGTQKTMHITDYSGNFRAGTDNTQSLGTTSYRWSVLYAGTGTINTSDDRLKTYLTIEEKEILVAKQLKKLIKKFKFNDSIEAKGKDNARIHFGTSAQSVKKAFEDNGLDPFNYALLCYDEWKDEYEQILDKKEVLDNEGNIISEATYKNGKIINKSGNRYGIRYDELLCFIMSAL